jgi:uncharacterized phage protein gp47/JayE
MPFARPTQAQLVARIIADIETELPGADARLRHSFERVLARVLSKLSHYQHAHLDWLSRQFFADTADDEELDRLTYVHRLPDGQGGVGRKMATQATGTVQVSGYSPGVVTAGAQLARADGALFTVDEEYTFTTPATSTVSLAVTAVDAGAAGNTDASSILTFTSPPTYVESETTVDATGLANGADRESNEATRTRLLAHIGAAGAGGAEGDYVVWALDASSSVTRAWELPLYLDAPNTVLVLIADDNLSGVVPSDATVDAVQEILQTRTYDATLDTWTIEGLAPVTVECTVQAVAVAALAVSATVTLDEDATQADTLEAIEAEIAALILRLAEPGVSITTSQILGAIQRARGVLTATLTSPVATTTHTATQIPIPGVVSITWA